MLLASIILDIPTQSLDAPYTYVVNDAATSEDAFEVEVGCAVLVPFGRRRAVGFVVGLEECEPDSLPEGIDPTKLKAIDRAISKPYFDEEGAVCARFIAERYVAPLSACVRLFTPPGGVPRLVQGYRGEWHLEEPKTGEVDDRWVVLGPNAESYAPRKNAVKQAAVMEALRRGDLRVSELTVEFGAISSVLKALESKGAVSIERRRRMRGVGSPEPKGTELLATDSRAVSGEADEVGMVDKSRSLGGVAKSSVTMCSPSVELTQGQQDALMAIEAARRAASGEVVLVDGVTGSGKTEVYLQAIAAVLAEGRNAIVLVPEISLTPQTVARFRGRFGDSVAVMHSRMSAGERYDQWDFIRSGAARVVVGARSALFTPLKDVGLVVIDEEHEGSYKQDSAPRYHARDVAAWMMSRSGGALVLGSATPSVETLHACATREGWHRVVLPERANGRSLPQVDVIDMAKEFHTGFRSMFSGKLIRALEEELVVGHKAVLLLNQRGFAKFLLCRDCGFVPQCEHCATSLTFHEQGNQLICHHCGHTEPAPAACPECGSPYLKKFGAGTQRVEAELRALLDGMASLARARGEAGSVPIIRMDADTTKRKGAHQELLERFAAEDAAVLLGTQMIAKGLDFDDVTLVGVINADTQLHLPDYRAAERTFSLIEQVAGRAGRAELPGRVMVQTYEASSPAIRAAAAHDRAAFLKRELPQRKAFGYPPYVRMANILVWGGDEDEVRKEAEHIHAQLKQLIFEVAGDRWTLFPAAPCALSKLRNTYRYHILVKCPPEDDMSARLAILFRARKASRTVNVAVDVDPVDLL